MQGFSTGCLPRCHPAPVAPLGRGLLLEGGRLLRAPDFGTPVPAAGLVMAVTGWSAGRPDRAASLTARLSASVR